MRDEPPFGSDGSPLVRSESRFGGSSSRAIGAGPRFEGREPVRRGERRPIGALRNRCSAPSGRGTRIRWRPRPALFAKEFGDSPAHVVANLAHALDRLPLRILERPIVAPQTRNDRALLPQPIVTEVCAGRELCVSMGGSMPSSSMPTSFIASSTSGWTRGPGSVPAEMRARLVGSARALNQAAAICERPALWTHANSTVFMGGSSSLRTMSQSFRSLVR